MNESQKGTLAALSSFILWGVFPIYFKLIAAVPSLEILAHRIFWSFASLLVFILFVQKRSILFWRLVSGPAILRLVLSSVLISLNWLVFIYAILTEQTVDASFGYFINPLVIVAMGVFFLKEKLSRWQSIGLSFAVLAVAYQLITLGELPWISLALAFSFGLYGMIRKAVVIDSIQGLFVETLLMAPVALGFLVYSYWVGDLYFLHHGLEADFWLVMAGIVTSVPLILFAVGVRRIPYSQIGFFQYVAPSIQLTVAIVLFDEPVSDSKLSSFYLVWVGLLVMLIGPRFNRFFGKSREQHANT